MLYLRRYIWCGLLAALLVGSIQTLVQRVQGIPIIIEAEKFELSVERNHGEITHSVKNDNANEHDHNHHHDDTWSPSNGTERLFWTWIANSLEAFSIALIIYVLMSIIVVKNLENRYSRTKIVVYVATIGWISFYLWPSLGLHAELPGVETGSLVERQLWWLLAAVSSLIASIILISDATKISRWAIGLILLSMPFIIEAPMFSGDPFRAYTGESYLSMQGLAKQFALVTAYISLTFWISIAIVTRLIFDQWLKPLISNS